MPLLVVSVVGDLPLAGYLGGLLKKPDDILWLRGSHQRDIVSRIEAVLAAQMSVNFQSRTIANEIEDFMEQCNQIIRDYPDHEIIFNTSGGSRLLVLMATEVFRKAGKEVIYIDMDHSRIVDVITGEKKTFQLTLTVNEYTELMGIKIESGTRFDPEIGKRSALSYFIGNNMNQVIPFIDKIRQQWIDMGDTKSDTQWRMNDDFHRFNISYEADSGKFRFRYGTAERQRSLEIDKTGDNYLFDGGWLRELVFLRVHRSQYDDVRLDVRLDRDTMPERVRAESMVDIAMMKGCAFYIFQCFSYPITRESFIELSAIYHTVRVLNAQGFVFLAHRPHRGFMERAHDCGLNVIYGRRVPNFSI